MYLLFLVKFSDDGIIAEISKINKFSEFIVLIYKKSQERKIIRYNAVYLLRRGCPLSVFYEYKVKYKTTGQL